MHNCLLVSVLGGFLELPTLKRYLRSINILKMTLTQRKWVPSLARFRVTFLLGFKPTCMTWRCSPILQIEKSQPSCQWKKRPPSRH